MRGPASGACSSGGSASSLKAWPHATRRSRSGGPATRIAPSTGRGGITRDSRKIRCRRPMWCGRSVAAVQRSAAARHRGRPNDTRVVTADDHVVDEESDRGGVIGLREHEVARRRPERGGDDAVAVDDRCQVRLRVRPRWAAPERVGGSRTAGCARLHVRRGSHRHGRGRPSDPETARSSAPFAQPTTRASPPHPRSAAKIADKKCRTHATLSANDPLSGSRRTDMMRALSVFVIALVLAACGDSGGGVGRCVTARRGSSAARARPQRGCPADFRGPVRHCLRRRHDAGLRQGINVPGWQPARRGWDGDHAAGPGNDDGHGRDQGERPGDAAVSPGGTGTTFGVDLTPQNFAPGSYLISFKGASGRSVASASVTIQ